MGDTVISVERLCKSYKIGCAERSGKTFREALTEAAWSPFRRLKSIRAGGNGNGTDEETFWALKDVSFEVKRGEVMGIIGRNGAGKSTLLKILSRITEPTSGKIRMRGRVASLLEVGTGFHPELTGRENIYLNGAILGMKRAEIARKFDEMVAFAEIDKFLDTAVKRYSSGMYVRLAFAVAAHLEPEILIVDEVLAVGDMEFQKKCLGKMKDVAQGDGRTVLFVSHNMAAIRTLCNRAVSLKKGVVDTVGETSTCISRYLTSPEHIGATILDHIESIVPELDIRDIVANGSTNDSCEELDPKAGINIGIDLFIKSQVRASIEAILRDADGNALAFFSPGHMSPGQQVVTLQAGQRYLQAMIVLPFLHRGRFTLDLSITEPGKKNLALFPGAFRFNCRGTATDTGHVFDQGFNMTGFQMLNGTVTTIKS